MRRKQNMLSGRISKKKLITGIISVIMCVVLYIFADSFLGMPDDGGMAVHFIDVGQGDAALILTEDASVLIDTGTTDSGEKVAAYIKERTDTIDYMILSHPHEDHIGGAGIIMNRVNVKNVIMPDVSADSSSFDKLLDALVTINPKLYSAKKGDTYTVGRLKLEIFSPGPDNMYDDTNNMSVVLKVTFGDTSFMFAGDAEAVVEEDLLAGGAVLDSHVLKVSHHGSSTSSTEPFIKAISPDIAVISCGKDNSYGHPHRETVELLEEYGVEYLRTDRSGTVIVRSNGKTVWAD